MKKIKTLKVRVKDKLVKAFAKQAASVNFVWNYIYELSHRSIKERRRFLSAYDFHPYTKKGVGKALGLHSQTLQEVTKADVTQRKQLQAKLKWCKSRGTHRSLGWACL